MAEERPGEDRTDHEGPPGRTPAYGSQAGSPRPSHERQGREGQPDAEPADLDVIVEGMEWQSDEIFSFYDRATGQVHSIQEEYLRRAENADAEGGWSDSMPEWERELMEVAWQIADDVDGRFVCLPDRSDIDEWAMMRSFAEGLSDDALSGRLLNAIHGKGAFRRFKDVVYEAGIEAEWFAFRNRAYRKIARLWCRQHDIPMKAEAPDSS
ncbi:MAG: UPF0158 family protein [Candidatus Brocadiia bacterium]